MWFLYILSLSTPNTHFIIWHSFRLKYNVLKLNKRLFLYIIWRLNMGKKPLSEKQIKSIRKLVESKPLHSLLLNLSVDLMLRGSDLLNLKVSDVMNESGSVKKEVKVRQKKTKKTTLSLPLSKNSMDVIKKHLSGKPQEDFIFKGQILHWKTNIHYSVFQNR